MEEEKDSATIARLEKAIEALDHGAEFYVDRKSPDDPIPEIYTNSAYIDQPEA